MSVLPFKSLLGDARHFQILSLSTLAITLFLWSDFGPTPAVACVTILSCLITQFILSHLILGKGQFEFRSALITSLSLTLLLKATYLWLFPIAACLAISSKFLIRANDKHIFNPANFAIVALLLLIPDMIWVSPAQWGREIWLAFLAAGLAFLVLTRISKADIALFFLGSYWGLLLARALILGDPMAIFMNQMEQGVFLIFAFFMISDPRTTPNSRFGRLIFAFAVASIAYLMHFIFQIREGIFYALFIVSMTTPLIDTIFKGQKFQWRLS